MDSADEAGHNWQRVTDGLGRLTAVMEPNPTTNALSLETDYSYDALDSLTRVDQWGGAHGASGERARTFTYGSQSRLVSSSNPETGTICNGQVSGGTCTSGYDVNGNLGSKTDARGVVVSYTYDALNRLTQKSYPTVPYGVAPTSSVGHGRRGQRGLGLAFPDRPELSEYLANKSYRSSRFCECGNSTSTPNLANAWMLYGYDAMGRIVLKSECLPIDCGNNHHELRYRYDLAGDMTFYDRGLDGDRNSAAPSSGYYFGGYTQTYNAAGHLASVTGDTPGTNLATNILATPYYYAAGELNQAQLLGKYSTTRTYSNRDWYTGQSITNTAGLDSWSSSATYDHAGRVTNTHDSYGGNWTYGYDSLNRLSSASGPSGAVSYTMDGFGNRSAQTVTSGSAPAPSFGTNTQNRMTGNGVTYDAAGNVPYDGFHTYTYDGEGRLYSVDGSTCYAYDGEGDRVATTNCNVTNRPNGTTSGITAEFLYDPSHNLMTEINVGTEQMQRANIYAGGWFVAEDSPDPFLTNSSVATQLRITDQVGSLRGLSDLGNPKGLWSGAWSSFPYGDGAVAGDGAVP